MSSLNRMLAEVESYTGNDIAVKQEIIPLFINDIKELMSALCLYSCDMTRLKATIHKVKTTISLTNDVQLQESLYVLTSNPAQSTAADQAMRTAIHCCDKVIVLLEQELARN